MIWHKIYEKTKKNIPQNLEENFISKEENYLYLLIKLLLPAYYYETLKSLS